jgi:hypothetical protein
VNSALPDVQASPVALSSLPVEYPQRQKAASFNMDEVMNKLQEPHNK